MRTILRWYFSGLVGLSIFTAGIVTGIALNSYVSQLVAKAEIARAVERWRAQRNH